MKRSELTKLIQEEMDKLNETRVAMNNKSGLDAKVKKFVTQIAEFYGIFEAGAYFSIYHSLEKQYPDLKKNRKHLDY